MEMKIHSVGWGWTPTPEDMPEGDSLARIADNAKALGFDGVDYLSAPDSLDAYFTPEKCAEIREHCKKIDLDIGGFVFQSDAWNNPCEKAQAEQLHYFEKCVNAADGLGAKIISCIIPRPFAAKPNRAGSPSEKVAYNLPKDFCWEKEWGLFTTMLRKACDIAATKGITIALECFPGSLCSTPDAMLRVIADVKRPNFGIQLDTAHLGNQRIDVETAIFMLGGENIKHVHLKDTDRLTRGNLPAGSGLIDYTAVFRALEAVGYKGRASIEVEFTDNPKRYMKQGLDHARMCLRGEY